MELKANNSSKMMNFAGEFEEFVRKEIKLRSSQKF